MKNDDSKNSQSNIGEEPPDAATNGQANAGSKTSEKAKKKTAQSTGKKWTLREHWNRATKKQRLEWIGGGLVGLVVLVYYGSQIWNAWQSGTYFAEEHRPKVIISKPPLLIETFACQVSQNAIHLYSGSMRVAVKNIRQHDAIGAFVVGPEFKLVPEKKLGDPFFDDLPSITDSNCKVRPAPKMKLFPVHAQEEVSANIRQTVGVVSLVKTNQVSVTLGGPQPEPQTPKGETPAPRPPIDKDTVFQLYGPVCVYYSDYKGNTYGSCRTYRLSIEGRPENSDQYSFSCSQTPIRGSFEAVFAGYCEN